MQLFQSPVIDVNKPILSKENLLSGQWKINPLNEKDSLATTEESKIYLDAEEINMDDIFLFDKRDQE